MIDITLTTGYMGRMNWDECYQKGAVLWDKGAPAPAMKQYLARHAVRGCALYPHLAERFVMGSLFDPPEEMRGAYDVVLEHTCMSGLPPMLRANYRRGIDLTLRRGGLLIGVWFINPALDPGKEGPPFPFSVADLTALFAEGYAIVEDYMPDVAFPGREGRERVRVLRRVV